jgi:hypothetical protein
LLQGARPTTARVSWTGRADRWRCAPETHWKWLYPPAEQARIMRLLIERIDVAPDGISVTLHAAGIRSLVAEVHAEAAVEEGVLEAAE